MAKLKEGEQPYSNMLARRIVLLIGFAFSLVGFAFTVFGLTSYLAPNSYSSLVLFKSIFSTGLATSFIGCIFSVAGANTNKLIARLAFFFSVVGFIISAAMLVITLAIGLLPIDAINRVVNK